MTTSVDAAVAESETIAIRRAGTEADYRACQDAQRRSWGIAEDGYLIPIATMVGANLHGGLVLGAFLPGGEAVAMSFAFLGRIEGQLCLYSQLTGVVPGYQSQGLGFQMKIHQREFARGEGIDRIVWAFDPLQAGNAHFNLRRLGATASRFVENMYGERTDALNAGVPTDRLIAEWDIRVDSEERPPPDDADMLPTILRAAANPDRVSAADPLAAPIAIDGPADAARLRLEIPTDITRLRRDRSELAERWRIAVRDAFRFAFDRGYRATSFVRDAAQDSRRVYYILDRSRIPTPRPSPPVTR